MIVGSGIARHKVTTVPLWHRELQPIGAQSVTHHPVDAPFYSIEAFIFLSRRCASGSYRIAKSNFPSSQYSLLKSGVLPHSFFGTSSVVFVLRFIAFQCEHLVMPSAPLAHFTRLSDQSASFLVV
jgi:hypothetical protein